MPDTLFFPSGSPSITMVRELLGILPNAVVIADIETAQLLGMSETAKQIFGKVEERWFECAGLFSNASDWEAGVAQLEANGGGPTRMVTTLFSASGTKFIGTCWVRVATMAGRKVLIWSIEPGSPQELDALQPPIFYTIDE